MTKRGFSMRKDHMLFGTPVTDKGRLAELRILLNEAEARDKGRRFITPPARQKEIADIIFEAFHVDERCRHLFFMPDKSFNGYMSRLFLASERKICISERGLEIGAIVIVGSYKKHVARIRHFTFDYCLYLELLDAPHLVSRTRITFPEEVRRHNMVVSQATPGSITLPVKITKKYSSRIDLTSVL